MKKFVLDFVHRGLIACGIGPIVLVVIYLILSKSASLAMLTLSEVCVAILSLLILAFIAGGMNSIYQIENLPLMRAILIHGLVLYVCYLITYLVNNWLESGIIPVMVFTAIFVVGYLAIWVIIYLILKRNTSKVNRILRSKQEE